MDFEKSAIMSDEEMDEEDKAEAAMKDLRDVANQIKKYKSDPRTAGMFVSGWDDDTDGVEECKNPRENPSEHILWAAENGDLDIVVELLDQDAALANARDEDGYTPLHRASYNNHVRVISVLLSRGADFAAKTNVGWQPLHSACHWNHYQCAARLLSAGANPNCRSDGDQTPLHIASSMSHCKSTLLVLLFHDDIDPDVLNRSEEKPSQLARAKGIYEPLFEMVEPCVRYIKSRQFTCNPYYRTGDG